jgi:hypothetical protein
MQPKNATTATQICLAYRSDGGTAVVVLSQREKLEMEELFRRGVPERARHGSRLVFRQGSPLVPADLQLVAASSAGATIIVSDQSRCARLFFGGVVACFLPLLLLCFFVPYPHASNTTPTPMQTKPQT